MEETYFSLFLPLGPTKKPGHCPQNEHETDRREKVKSEGPWEPRNKHSDEFPGFSCCLTYLENHKRRDWQPRHAQECRQENPQ